MLDVVGQVPRDRVHPARRDRRHEAEASDAGNREARRHLQVREPRGLLVGGPGPADQGRHLRQEHGAERERHLEAVARPRGGQKVR